MGLEDVDGRLEKGQLATVRAPSGKGRHSSLHQIVASTLALVELEDQKMASRVAVFQGGFRLDDAQSVLGDSRDTLDQLSRLRDCSLLLAETRVSGLWYRQLDSVREFLREVTPPEELLPWRAGHARHYAGLALDVRSLHERSEDSTVAEILAVSGGNLRTGLVFAIETGDDRLIRDYAFGLSRAFVEAGLLQDLATLAASGPGDAGGPCARSRDSPRRRRVAVRNPRAPRHRGTTFRPCGPRDGALARTRRCGARRG